METGEQTNAYTLTGGADSTYTDTETGNSVTGGYTLTASSNDSDSYTRTGTDADDDTFSITQSDSADGTAITTGNHIQGGYTVNSTGTTSSTLEEQISGDTDNSTLSQTTTGTSSLTETGNEITGNFTSTDDQSNTTTLDQSGTNANGTFSVDEYSTDTPTVVTTGDSIDGDQTITTTGDRNYSVTEYNSSGGGGFVPASGYYLTETGSNPYTRTEIDNANDGQQSTTETGTDTYSITDLSGGLAIVAQSLSGTDTYTMTGSLNTQTGGFSLTTSGSGTSTGGDTSFTTTETGDTRDGSVTSSNTGTNRYDLLGGINNTADGANAGVGMADFSPVGAPIYVGRSSTPSGMFSSVGNDQYQYCFAKGTMIRMADGTTKAIEMIEPGTMVPASPERNPGGVRSACEVLEAYHNSPVEILNLTVSSSIDPLNGDLIRTTAEHPFYVTGKGWTKAKDLGAGDRLMCSGEDSVKVKSIARSGSIEPVFNLHVAMHHTYFVVTASGNDVLVHNNSSGQDTTADFVLPTDAVQPTTAEDYLDEFWGWDFITALPGDIGSTLWDGESADSVQGFSYEIFGGNDQPLYGNTNAYNGGKAVGDLTIATDLTIASSGIAAPVTLPEEAQTLENFPPTLQVDPQAVSLAGDEGTSVSTTTVTSNPVTTGSVNYGALDQLGRPTGVTATITQDMIGTGTPPNSDIIPPGWSGDGTLFNEARGHLLGAQLGGSGDLPENLVTLQQYPANAPVMSGFEGSVRSVVENAQAVEYSSTPIYDGDNLVPRGITISAQSPSGFSINVTILNPAGQ